MTAIQVKNKWLALANDIEIVKEMFSEISSYPLHSIPNVASEANIIIEKLNSILVSIINKNLQDEEGIDEILTQVKSTIRDLKRNIMFLPNVETNNKVTDCNNNNVSVNVNIPKLNIPTFNGKCEDIISLNRGFILIAI